MDHSSNMQLRNDDSKTNNSRRDNRAQIENKDDTRPDLREKLSSRKERRSPERKRASSPNPKTGKTNSPPKQDRPRGTRRARSRSPRRARNNPKHARSRSPQRRSSRSPQRRNSRSPLRSRNSRSPQRSRNSRSPQRRSSRSPQRSRNSRSPRRGRSRSPIPRRNPGIAGARGTGSRSPPQERASAQKRRQADPPRRGRSRSPNRRSRSPKRGASPPFFADLREALKEEPYARQSDYIPSLMELRPQPSDFDDGKYEDPFQEGQSGRRGPFEEPSFRYADDQEDADHQAGDRRRFAERPRERPREDDVRELHFEEEAAAAQEQQPPAEPAAQEVEPFSGESDRSVRDWLRDIEECGRRNRWDNKMKTFHMTSKLAGFARSWYIALEDTNIEWHVWKEKLTRAFPCDQDYDKQLTQMLARRKESTETFDKYFCHKVAMLNACDITGRRAVACVLGGLRSREVVREARQRNFDAPEKLYAFLCGPDRVCFVCMGRGHAERDCPGTQPRAEATPKRPETPLKDLGLGSDLERLYRGRRRKRAARRDPTVPQVGCAFCRDEAHPVHRCPLIGADKKAEMFGPLGSAAADEGEVSKASIMFGVFRNAKCFTKYFVDVCVNGAVLGGYVDDKSEHVTIRQEDAVRLKLPVRKMYKMIQGFAGSNLSTHGEVEVTIRVDMAVARVLAYVVPDHIQAIAVIVGKSFVQLPNFLLDASGKTVRIWQDLQHMQRYPPPNSVVSQQQIVFGN